jgi:predicted nuclease with TOPRIM domain
MGKGSKVCPGGKSCCGGLNWVQCDLCNRFEMYENSGFAGEYDEKKVESLKFVCKICELVKWKDVVSVKVDALEKQLTAVNDRLERVEKNVEAVKEDSVKVMREVGLSVNERQAETVDKIDGIGRSVSEVQQKVEVVTEEVGSVCTRQVELIERLDVIGGSLTEVQERVENLADKLGSIDGSVAEIGVKQVELDQLLESKKDSTELYSVVASRRQAKVNRKAVNAEPVTVAVAQGHAVGESVGAANRPAFAEQCAKHQAGTVLLVGSSLARGVGQHLKADNLMFDKLDFSGARIEHIREKLEVVGERPESHIVVMAGSNNLRSDCVMVMLKKYDELFEWLQHQKYRKVSIVNVLQRRDCEPGKINLVNQQLKVLCEQRGVGFVEASVDRMRMLGRDGVHLNWRGCDTVAQAVFNHCCESLNFV